MENEDLNNEEMNEKPESEQNELEQNSEETIEDKIALLEAEKADLIDKMQRSLAEFDNYRKRSMKEKGQMFDEGVKTTIANLLPVVDNLERAIGSFENKEDSTFKGFEMIFRQLLSILDEIGIKQIETVGKKFNTEYHHAVSHEESGEFGENEVIEELQKGYIYKDKVIRCAMVKVVN